MVMEIPLTKGYVALVDDADYEWVSRLKWHAGSGGAGDGLMYALTTMRRDDGSRYKNGMHREIAVRMGICTSKTVDHIDRNTLNNTRNNLRPATYSEQQMNQRTQVNSSSGYRGVTWSSREGKFRARVRVKGKEIHVGFYSTPEEAARARDRVASIYHGEYAWLNCREAGVTQND